MRVPIAVTAGIAVTAFIAVLGALAVAGSIGYGIVTDDSRVGVGFLPGVAGATVAVCALIDLGRRLLARRHVRFAATSESAVAALPDAESDRDIFGRSQRQRTRMLIVVVGLVVLTLLLVPLLGFVLAFAVLLLSCSVLVERRRPLPALAVTAGALGIAYLVFAVLLRVPLPTGVLGFI